MLAMTLSLSRSLSLLFMNFDRKIKLQTIVSFISNFARDCQLARNIHDSVTQALPEYIKHLLFLHVPVTLKSVHAHKSWY